MVRSGLPCQCVGAVLPLLRFAKYIVHIICPESPASGTPPVRSARPTRACPSHGGRRLWRGSPPSTATAAAGSRARVSPRCWPPPHPSTRNARARSTWPCRSRCRYPCSCSSPSRAASCRGCGQRTSASGCRCCKRCTRRRAPSRRARSRCSRCSPTPRSRWSWRTWGCARSTLARSSSTCMAKVAIGGQSCDRCRTATWPSSRPRRSSTPGRRSRGTGRASCSSRGTRTWARSPSRRPTAASTSTPTPSFSSRC